MTGYSASEIICQSASLLRADYQDKGFYQDLNDTLNACGRWNGEIGIGLKNGQVCIRWLSISSDFDNYGNVVRRFGMFSDFIEKRHVEASIREQANIDPLTKLPNLRLFLDRLERAINKSRRTKQQFALMFLDLDNFKEVNDTLGHDVGDNPLKEAAERLKGCIRETDTLARPGGYEFTIILSELDEVGSVNRVARSIRNRMAVPFQFGGEERAISFSIGITIYPVDSINLDDLLKKADQAMYAAKHQGRNRFCYFTSFLIHGLVVLGKQNPTQYSEFAHAFALLIL